MRRVQQVVLALVVAVCGPWSPAEAADTWLEVRSDNFTVVSNANERQSRDVAWQFEQIRAAILAGWPWARSRFDRPILVIAAKDEATMKGLAPEYWEQRGRVRPDSVFVQAPDRYYITLRADVRGDGEVNVNPYFSSYWSYSAVALNAAFERELPLWFRNGLAGVLSNSIVRPTEIRFGLPIPWYLTALRQEGRLRLPALFDVTPQSPYYTSASTRDLFDAQSWALVHFMLFGRPGAQDDKVNELAKLLLDGRSSAEAVEQVFGSVSALDAAYMQSIRKEIQTFARLKVETAVAAKDFVARPLAAPDAAAVRAGWHAATRRPAEARALIEEAKRAPNPPARAFEAEALVLDREGKRDEARAALVKAEELQSDSYYVHHRLAALTLPERPDAASLAPVEQRLRRALALNDAHPPTHALLANVLTDEGKGDLAVNVASRAVSLDATDFGARLALARALWVAGRRAEANGQGRAAHALATTDQQRAAAQSLLDFFARVQPAK